MIFFAGQPDSGARERAKMPVCWTVDLRIQTSLIAAVVSTALAASVLLRSRKRRDQWLFGVFGTNMGLWYLTTFLTRVVGSAGWSRLNLTFGVLLPFSALEFFRAFIAEENLVMRRLHRAALLFALGILVAIATPWYDHIVVRTAIFTYVVVFLFAALALLYARARQVTSRFEGGRLYFLAAVGGLAGFFALFEYLPYLGVDLPPVGTLLTLIFLYMLSQSVVRSRLIDLYELAGRLAVLTSLSFALASLLWVLVRFAGGKYFLHAVVASLVVLVLFDPLRAKVSARLAQLLFRERYDLERAIVALRADVAHVLEVDDLVRVLVDGLERSRRVTHAALFLADRDQRSYKRMGHVGPAPVARLEAAPARPLLDRLTREEAVVLENVQRQLEEHREHGEDREAEMLYEISQSLEAMNASVCLAIRSESADLYGLLVIRDERLRDAYSPEEIQLFSGLAAQVAIALDNSRHYQRLKERDRLAALGEMAAGLAHEIRNPLGAIKASAQYLTEGEFHEGDGEFLDIIVDEVDRLNRVVGSFLDYARPSRGHPSPTDVNDAVERTIRLVRPECDAAGVDVVLELGSELPRVSIDVEQMRQVLLNLMNNAVQAMEGLPDKRIVVSTELGKPERSRACARVCVRDTGRGIPDDVLPLLFVPFVTTKQRGTGLGLAISQRIVSASGGRIEVRTESGAGTTFAVILPGVETREDEVLQSSDSVSSESESAADSGESEGPMGEIPSSSPVPSVVTTSR